MFKKYSIVLIFFALLAVSPLLRPLFNTAQASSIASPTITAQEQPVIAAMFYSNWCGACQILDPRIEAVKPAFAGHNVDFVKFDFSYALVRGKAIKALAEEKGIANIYAKNKGRTGFMLLIDPVTQTVMDIVTIRDSKEAIAAKLQRSLHRALPVRAVAKAG